MIDLRGNKGGDSAIGDVVIAQVFGEESLQSLRADGTQCPVLWRASPDNAQWVQAVADRLRDSQPNRARGLDLVVQQMRAAIANRKPFSEEMPASCAKPETPKASRTHPIRSDVTVVTDQDCFSSCLLLVERLLKLGARQAGETTSTGNWYMEVRSISLPSGLGRFSTLQKVDLRRPKALGPFMPTQ